MGCVLLLILAQALVGGELEDAEKAARKWQRAFYMADWQIRVSMVPASLLTMLCGHCLAASAFNVEARSGELLIMRRADYTKEVKTRLGITDVKADQRNSVVHELLHNVVQHLDEEAAVQVITAALKP